MTLADSNIEQIGDLYFELAVARIGEARDKLAGTEPERLFARGAEAVEQAAGALVLIYAYSTPDTPASTRFRDQIGDLVGLASRLEQAADQGRSPDL
jgi:hypothetical protein